MQARLDQSATAHFAQGDDECEAFEANLDTPDHSAEFSAAERARLDDLKDRHNLLGIQG